jgi:hypothetical protein
MDIPPLTLTRGEEPAGRAGRKYSGCGRARAARQKPHGLWAPVDKIFGP